MTISSTLSLTYTTEAGEKKQIDINSILHDLRVKFTQNVSRSENENTITIYRETLETIKNIFDSAGLETPKELTQYLQQIQKDSSFKFFADEMNQTPGMNYGSGKEHSKKSENLKNLLIKSFDSLITTIKEDYKNNSYKNRSLPSNYEKFMGMGVVYFGASDEMRALRDDSMKDVQGLLKEESEFINSLDDKELNQRMNKYMKDLEKQYGIKILYSSCHRDEKTKHWHFCYTNYNFKEHKSLMSDMSKFELKKRGIEIQNMVQASFDDMSLPLYKGKQLNIKRGVERTTSVKNKSISEMKKAEIKDLELISNKKQLELKEINSNCETMLKMYVETNTEVSKTIDKIETMKDELEGLYSIKSELIKNIEEFKDYDNKLKDIKKEVKILGKELNIPNSEIKSVLDILDETKKNIKTLKNGFIESKSKYEEIESKRSGGEKQLNKLKNLFIEENKKLNFQRRAYSQTIERIQKCYKENATLTNKQKFFENLAADFGDIITNERDKKLLEDKVNYLSNENKMLNKFKDNFKIIEDKAIKFDDISENYEKQRSTIITLNQTIKEQHKEIQRLQKFDPEFIEKQKLLEKQKQIKQNSKENSIELDFEDR